MIIFFFYLLQPISFSLLLDSFDSTIKQSGHSSDLNQSESWGLKELWKWVIDCNPTKKLDQDLLKKRRQKELDDLVWEKN
jgi:hypothetical protein